MSTSTRACHEFSVPIHRKSPGKAGSQGFSGSAAIACLVVGCAWTVYANVFGASVYPALSDGNFDAPVIRRPSAVAARNLPLVADNSVIVESAPVVSRPATVAPGPSLSFAERFAAAEPNSVAPAPAPKLALASPQPDAAKPVAPPAAQLALNIPLPAARPAEARKDSGASVRDMARRAKAAVMAAVAPPEKPPTLFERLFGKSESRGSMLSYASADVSSTSSLGPSQNIGTAGTVPMYDRQTAVYDISAHMVYLPDGTRLEAHSGLGSQLDDPNSARVRMRGVTPPHLYDLKPRETLFHGVPALRLTPIGGDEAIYGRSGLLAHTYMLGPNGDSNGCVSFKDYNAFLQAYRNGEIKRLAVVARL
jgi:type VI secretion system (T6SS) effector TldE1-like protein